MDVMARHYCIVKLVIDGPWFIAKHEIHPSHEGYLSDLYLVNPLNLLLITAGKQRSVAHEGLLQISAGAKRRQMVLQLGPHEGSSDLYRRISQQRPYCKQHLVLSTLGGPIGSHCMPSLVLSTQL